MNKKPIEDEEAKIAIFVCHCGEEIGAVVDFEKTIEFAKELPNVTLVEDVGFLCLPETLEKVKQSVTESGANRVVMAACAPYHYYRLFNDALKEAGIDASLWQLVNFREQLAWVHKDNKSLATEKAQSLLAIAVQRLKVQELLTSPSMAVSPEMSGNWRRYFRINVRNFSRRIRDSPSTSSKKPESLADTAGGCILTSPGIIRKFL